MSAVVLGIMVGRIILCAAFVVMTAVIASCQYGNFLGKSRIFFDSTRSNPYKSAEMTDSACPSQINQI